jgi:sec-independent protein translocase protein TatA
MFNLGLPELLMIGAAGLLLFGPKRLPELGKSLGKGIRDFKKALDGNEDENQQPPTQIPPAGTTAQAPQTPKSDAEKVGSTSGDNKSNPQS